MFLLYLLGCWTSIQLDFLAVLVVFYFLICCCPSFGCVRRYSVPTYASILAGSSKAYLFIFNFIFIVFNGGHYYRCPPFAHFHQAPASFPSGHHHTLANPFTFFGSDYLSPMKPEMLTIRPFKEKVCQYLV